MSTDQEIEQEIQAKGLTAPRITPADIEACIASEHYFTAADGIYGAERDPRVVPVETSLCLLTFCVLVLENGFTVTGESACASPENFDAEVGKKIARQNATNKIWPLLGFALRSKLAAQRTGSCTCGPNEVCVECAGEGYGLDASLDGTE